MPATRRYLSGGRELGVLETGAPRHDKAIILATLQRRLILLAAGILLLTSCPPKACQHVPYLRHRPAFPPIPLVLKLPCKLTNVLEN
jgi:hypothetical protein